MVATAEGVTGIWGYALKGAAIHVPRSKLYQVAAIFAAASCGTLPAAVHAQSLTPSDLVARLSVERRAAIATSFKVLDQFDQEAARLLAKRDADRLQKLGDAITDKMGSGYQFVIYSQSPAEQAATPVLQPCEQSFADLAMLTINADGILRNEKDEEPDVLKKSAESYRASFSRCGNAVKPGAASAILMDEISRINAGYVASRKR